MGTFLWYLIGGLVGWWLSEYLVRLLERIVAKQPAHSGEDGETK